MTPRDVAHAGTPASRRRFGTFDWKRGLKAALLTLVVLVVLDGLWVGVRGERAKNHLLRVRDAVASARQLATAGSFTDAQATATAVHRDTAAAVRLTSDPIWHLDGHLPWLGSSFQDVAALADVSDNVAVNVLPQLGNAEAAAQGGIAGTRDGRLDVSAFTSVAKDLPIASGALAQAVTQLQALPSNPLLSAARSSRDGLLEVFQALSQQVATPALAAKVGPSMLGESGPRTYFLALVTPAESRGGGGIIGGFAYIRADKGRLSLLPGSGSDADLKDFGTDVTTLSPAFQQSWERFGVERSWRNADLSPDFPSTAKILTAMSAKRGVAVNGVISLDPAGAGALLQATGPITTADGTLLTSPADVSRYVESTLYARYPRDPEDQPARKQALVDLQKLLFARVTQAPNARLLLSALAAAAGQGHLHMASTDPAEEAVLASTPLGGAVSTMPGPFAGVSIQNSIGNKTDFYLRRDFAWTAAACPADGGNRTSTQTVTLTNTTPGGLTHYVAGSSDPKRQNLPLGTDRIYVTLYGSIRGTGVRATIDGATQAVTTGSEAGHPAVSAFITLLPGQSKSFSVTFNEPSAGVISPPMLPPLFLPGQTTVNVPDCGS